MSLYYNGDLEKDLKILHTSNKSFVDIKILDNLGKELGYGRCQQILQILWAKHLKDQGLPTNGALFR